MRENFRYPSIQVFIPTYNRSTSLRRSIESVRIQTYVDFEVVVLDNCSTDDTANIIASLVFLEPRLKHIRWETNIGMMQNFNSIAGLVTSPFFCVLTDDDVYEPDFLENAMSLFERYDKADAAIFNAPTRKNGIVIKSQLDSWNEGFYNQWEALPYVIGGRHPILTNCLFKASVKNLFFFKDDLRGSADIYFFVTLVAECSVAVSKIISGYYDITGSNESVLVDGVERVYQRMILNQYVCCYLGMPVNGKNGLPPLSWLRALIVVVRYSNANSICNEIKENRVIPYYGVFFRLALIFLAKEYILLSAKSWVEMMIRIWKNLNRIRFLSSLKIIKNSLTRWI